MMILLRASTPYRHQRDRTGRAFPPASLGPDHAVESKSSGSECSPRCRGGRSYAPRSGRSEMTGVAGTTSHQGATAAGRAGRAAQTSARQRRPGASHARRTPPDAAQRRGRLFGSFGYQWLTSGEAGDRPLEEELVAHHVLEAELGEVPRAPFEHVDRLAGAVEPGHPAVQL